MDWLKLFAFLVAVTSTGDTAELPSKKIRIHLPQKVKHIHHHKKIYITNHPASSQYAPAYTPGSEGASAMTSNVIIPAVPTYVQSLNSIEPYEEFRARQPLYAATSSKTQPFYRTRDPYEPTPSEWDEEEQYDVNSSIEPADAYSPTGFAVGSGSPATNYILKKPKGKEPLRKKPIPKNKPKQVIIRGKPIQEEEHPVTTFHEQFYSDVQGLGTIKKIKKPQRVEKIIDGDTEHIHTYSEEHIHKVIFDDGAKITGMPVDDPINGVSVLPASRLTKPVKNPNLLGLPSNPFTGFSYGPMEAPASLEYAAYNPHDVTHDHIFHDHGEIPPDVDVSKDPLLYPPRVSYNSKGVRIGEGPVDTKLRYSNNYNKAIKTTPITDFSYQEFTPYQYMKTKSYKNFSPYIDTTSQKTFDDFRPIPYHNFREKSNLKSDDLVPSLYFDNEQTQQTSVPTPFSISSTIIHDYTPKSYSGRTTGSTDYLKFKDPLLDFKDTYASNVEYDTSAASSNFYPVEEKREEPVTPFHGRKGKSKSISKQNIKFLSHNQKPNDDRQDFHNEGFSTVSSKDEIYSALDFNKGFEVKPPDVVSVTPSNVKESSSAYSYYTAMAIKALHEEQQQEQSVSTTPYTPSLGTKVSLASENYNISTVSPISIVERRQRPKINGKSNVHSIPVKYNREDGVIDKNKKFVQASKYSYLHRQLDESASPSSRPKYGDKLN